MDEISYTWKFVTTFYFLSLFTNVSSALLVYKLSITFPGMKINEVKPFALKIMVEIHTLCFEKMLVNSYSEIKNLEK